MDDVELTGHDPIPPEPPTDPLPAAIRDLLRQIDRLRRVLVVHPGDFDRVQAAVAQLPIEFAPGLIEVRAERFCPPGYVYFLDPNAFQPLPTLRMH